MFQAVVISFGLEEDFQKFCQELLASGLIDNYNGLKFYGVNKDPEEFP
jgi:hypothetical protein